jgi:hypothetical protein
MRLAELFEGFTVEPNAWPETARAEALGLNLDTDNPEDSADFWRECAAVVGLVQEVDRAVRSLDKSGVSVEPYVATIPEWYAAAFGYNIQWNLRSDKRRKALGEMPLVLLRALGATLEFAHVTVDNDGAEGDVDQLVAALFDIEEVVVAAVYLPESMRNYVLALVDEALAAVRQYQKLGSTPLRKITLTLAGLIDAVANTGVVPAEAETKLRESLRKILTTWVTAAGISIAGFAGGYAQRAISGPTPDQTLHVVIDSPSGDSGAAKPAASQKVADQAK